jgi:hypothetical protein
MFYLTIFEGADRLAIMKFGYYNLEIITSNA